MAPRTLQKRTMKIFYAIASVVVFLGPLLDFAVVWDLADVLMGVMAIINLPVIIALCKPAMKAAEDYLAQKKAGKDPVFKSTSIGLKDKLDFWN